MKSKKYFPSEKILKPIRDKLSDPHYNEGSIALPANATDSERVKYQICEFIIRYKREQGCLQKEIAKKIGADESRVSEILRCKIESFTLERLFEYAKKLYPKLKIQISAA